MHTAETTDTAANILILESAVKLRCAIERLMEQEPGPQDPLFIINNFQHIAAFGRARLAFHIAMAARPNVHTDMFVPQAGDLKQAGDKLLDAVTSLALVANNSLDSVLAWQHQPLLAKQRSRYLHALEVFGAALGYPIYDPGALSYMRRRREDHHKESPLYFD